MPELRRRHAGAIVTSYSQLKGTSPDDAQEKLEEFLATRGLRLTPERSASSLIFSSGGLAGASPLVWMVALMASDPASHPEGEILLAAGAVAGRSCRRALGQQLGSLLL